MDLKSVLTISYGCLAFRPVRGKFIHTAGGFIRKSGSERLCPSYERYLKRLPYFLLPYKRYNAKAIECVLHGEDLDCVASIRTKKRWLMWYCLIHRVWLHILMLPFIHLFLEQLIPDI